MPLLTEFVNTDEIHITDKLKYYLLTLLCEQRKLRGYLQEYE